MWPEKEEKKDFVSRQAVEEAVSVEKIANALSKERFGIGLDACHESQYEKLIKEATAIRKQIMDELWGGEDGKS